LKNQSIVDLPLLDHHAVTECMQQGHHWSGAGLPWPMRESRQGRSGSFNSQHQGSGTDFTETRPYQPGDEIRHINWRAMARTGRPHVRVFQEDLAPVSCFLIDRRAKMRFGTRQRLKVTQAARLAVFLATWEARSGSELAGLILNEAPRWQPPVSGQNGIHQLARLATSPCPPLNDLSQIDINQALSQLAEQLPLGSHLYLLSDFSDLQEDILPRLYQLGKQHRVWAIGIHDPSEQQLPEAGHLQLVWNQNLDKLENTVINTDDAGVRQQHRIRFEQRQRQIKNLCEQAGIFYTSMSSSEDDITKALQDVRQ